MRMKQWVFLIIIAVLLGVPLVSGADVTTSSSTLREVTDTAYPVELFYAIAGIAGCMFFLDIVFLASRNGVPVSAFILTSTLGFSLFFIAAYMAPMTAKIVVVATETDVRSVANYIFSPWVSVLMQALGLICFLLVWYGVILYLRMIKHNKKQLERDEMFAITGIDMD